MRFQSHRVASSRVAVINLDVFAVCTYQCTVVSVRSNGIRLFLRLPPLSFSFSIHLYIYIHVCDLETRRYRFFPRVQFVQIVYRFYLNSRVLIHALSFYSVLPSAYNKLFSSNRIAIIALLFFFI